MNIRPYHPNDLDVVRDIWTRAKPAEFRGKGDLRAILPFDEDECVQKLFHSSKIFVGVVADRIVGFVGFKGDVITWLFVDPDCYRNGHGSALLSFILSRMGPAVRLNVGAGNTAAIELYEKHGFTVTRRFEGNHNGFPTKAMKMERTSH
jgi:ribosomal protein S18 acetylase RimI-like enzyme